MNGQLHIPADLPLYLFVCWLFGARGGMDNDGKGKAIPFQAWTGR
jgi:hypothetical protein